MAVRKKKHGGKRPNSGRKSKAVEQNLNALLSECVPAEQRELIIRKLADDAQHLSFKIRHESRKLLLSYIYGKPVERHELSGEDGGAIQITIIEPVKPNA